MCKTRVSDERSVQHCSCLVSYEALPGKMSLTPLMADLIMHCLVSCEEYEAAAHSRDTLDRHYDLSKKTIS